QQTLWAGTGDSGVFRFANGKFEQVWEYSEPGWNKRVYVIHGDLQGRMWFGTGMGLFCREREKVRKVAASRFPMGVVHSIAEDAKGRLWFGLAGGAETRLVCLEGDDLVGKGVADGLVGHDVFGLLADGDGTMWIGTVGQGLWRWRDGTFTRFGISD